MIYDITLPISPRLAVWPGDPGIESSSFGDQVKVSRWVLGSHTGTHVDAQTHFSAGSGAVDGLDPAVLLGPCRVLDLPDIPVVTADVLVNHNLIGVERLLLRTRNSLRWREDTTTFFTDYVALDDDAARTLLALGVKLIGVDGLSVAPFEGDSEVHEILLSQGMVLLEGLNLADIPAGDYQLVCAPLKLMGADGAPARVFLVE